MLPSGRRLFAEADSSLWRTNCCRYYSVETIVENTIRDCLRSVLLVENASTAICSVYNPQVSYIRSLLNHLSPQYNFHSLRYPHKSY